ILRLHRCGASAVGFIEDVGDIAVENGRWVEGDAEPAGADMMRDDDCIRLRHQCCPAGARPTGIVKTGSRTQSETTHYAAPQLAQQIEAADFVDAPPGISDRSGLAQLLEPPAVVKLAV